MKKCYIVTFELKNPGLNREKLITSIKTAAWARLSANTFLVTSFNDSEKIRDILLEQMYEGDKIYVGKVDNLAAWYGLDKDVSDWIHNNQK
jgi:hypothetical protein